MTLSAQNKGPEESGKRSTDTGSDRPDLLICPMVLNRYSHDAHHWRTPALDSQERYCGGWSEPMAYSIRPNPIEPYQLTGDDAKKLEELQDFPPLHSHVGDGKWHIDCDACATYEAEPPDPYEDAPDAEQFAVHNDRPVTLEDPRPDPDLKTASTEVTRWADRAMYEAAPIDANDGPRVYLLSMTPDPLGAIAAACKMYKGEVVRDLSTVTDAERLEYFQQVQKTKLKAPFEFVQFHFMIEGVTRAFTHQMVRQRTAAYAQESLRFAVKSDMPMGLPPSLAGTDDYWAAEGMPSVPETNEEHMRAIWESAKEYNQNVYNELVNMGMPAEDARGMLPHNVLTRLHYTTNLRSLLDHAGNRLCTQAQFEWRLVFARIIEAIRDKTYSNPETGYSSPKYANGQTKVYMANEILDAFRPVCFQTGKCEFKANFDRPCSIRERVDQNESAGRPSSEWDRDQVCHPEGCDHQEIEIQAIKPGEWLLDPTAARKR
jgi:flavin-dependent thymidylate synthase